MKTLYFLRGLPASGKTTWAKTRLTALNSGGKIQAIRTNKDEIRARLRRKGVNSESRVIRRETELVTKALKAGLDVIIDNTHFNPIHEWRYRDLAKEYGHQFEIVTFTDVPLEECIRRDQKRRNSVGGDVIRNMNIYRKSLRRGVVADLKRQWVAKRAAAARRQRFCEASSLPASGPAWSRLPGSATCSRASRDTPLPGSVNCFPTTGTRRLPHPRPKA